jgi:hypothetical protein
MVPPGLEVSAETPNASYRRCTVMTSLKSAAQAYDHSWGGLDLQDVVGIVTALFSPRYR